MIKHLRFAAIFAFVAICAQWIMAVESVNHLDYNWDETKSWKDGDLYFTIDPNHPYDGCALLLPQGEAASSQTEVTIPSVSNGKRVIAILASAFRDNKNVTKVTIPSTVLEVVPGAFAGAISLTTIEVDAESASYTSLNGVLLSKNNQELTAWPAALTMTNAEYRSSGLYDALRSSGTIADWACAYVANFPSQFFTGVYNLTIGDYAFYNSAFAKALSGVKYIGTHAFDGCSLLRSFMMSQYLGDYAFANSGITFPQLNLGYMEYCGKGIFMNCQDIQTAYISDIKYDEANPQGTPAGSTLPDSCFYNCPKLSSLYFNSDKTGGQSLAAVGKSAFENCIGLQEISIFGNINEIQSKAFAGCTGMATIKTYAPTPPPFASDAFEEVPKECILMVYSPAIDQTYANSEWGEIFTMIPPRYTEGDFTYDLTPNHPSLGNLAGIYEYTGSDSELTLPSSVSFGPIEFRVVFGISKIVNKSAIRKVNVPSSYTSIGGFEDCTELTEINFNDALAQINDNAFKNCTKLQIPEIPASVTNIGVNPFNNCTSVAEFKVADGNPQFSAIDGMLYSSNGQQLVAVPASLKTVSVPENTQAIATYAFASSVVTSVSLPSSIVSINANSFNDCPNLTDVTINEANTNYFIENGVIYKGQPTSNSIGLTVILPWVKDFVANGNTYSAALSSGGISNPEILESMEFPANVQNVTLPKKLPALKKVICRSEVSPRTAYINPATFDPSTYDFLSTATLYIPFGTMASYKDPELLWNYFTNIEEMALSGVDETAVSDNETPAEYFNLQGQRVENPSNGIFIRCQGSVTTKVVIP